jgi:hypothetical protein
MKEIKIEKLTTGEAKKILGAKDQKEGAPGGTSGNSTEDTCVCTCACIPDILQPIG